MRKSLSIMAIAASLALVPVAASGVAAADKTTCFGKEATHFGTPGNDVIYGTKGNDVIKTYGGNDVIYGRGGNDKICAGGGNDKILGGKGNDKIWGAAGNDIISGGAGNDIMFGVWGNDWFDGGTGTDTSREGARWGETTGVEVPRTVAVKTPMVRAATLRVKGWNTGAEVYLGNGTADGPRVEKQFEALRYTGGSAPVELSWVPGENAMVAYVNGTEAVYEFDSMPGATCSPQDWDIMEILVADNGVGVTFENAQFNGDGMRPLKNDTFDMNGYPAWPGGPGAVVMMDMDFDSAWTVTGDLVSVDPFVGAERNKVQLSVGCKTHPDRVLD